MNSLDMIAALPLLLLVTLTLGMLCLDLLFGCCRRLAWTLSACIGAWIFAFPQLFLNDTALHGLIFVDGFSWILTTIVLGGAILAFLLNHNAMGPQRAASRIDVDVLLMIAVIGALVMVSAAHLLVLFVGFELLSIAVYVLSGTARKERASTEGALKYFILGAFSSAFLLYGMVLVYGATGTMELAAIRQQASIDNSLLLLGIGLIIFGFGFKISLVPFHVWTPDVYQGAPVSITAFMAAVVKTAAFGSFLRLMYCSFGSVSQAWIGLLWVICVATMTVGNLVALRQRSVKRMLAYSSIAHAGYALIGLIAYGSAGGGAAAVFYLLVYTLMTIAAFGVVLIVTMGSSAQYADDDIDSLSGLGWTHPFLGIVMTIAMLSLAGFPPLAGFVGKVYLFLSALRGGFLGLALIAAVNSLISLYYYLRVLVVMYFGERTLDWTPPSRTAAAPALALTIVTIGIIYFGIFSESCIVLVQFALKSFGLFYF